MAFGIIPRFSPSFSPKEMWTCVRYLSRSGDDSEVVQRFEEEFAAFEGARHAVMVPSARYGLYLLLEGWGIGQGDEVIIPALTYFAIPALTRCTGATPVFADIGATTHVSQPDQQWQISVLPRHQCRSQCALARGRARRLSSDLLQVCHKRACG